jgi:hypothetical protein
MTKCDISYIREYNITGLVFETFRMSFVRKISDIRNLFEVFAFSGCMRQRESYSFIRKVK